jgi:hypothetical protein
MYPEPSSQPLCWRPIISGCLILPTLIMSASGSLATIGIHRCVTPGLFVSQSIPICDRTNEQSFNFSIMITVKAAKPCDSHRGTGRYPYGPEVSQVKKTDDPISNITANYPLRSPSLFRIVGLFESWTTADVVVQDLQCFRVS